MAIQYLDEPSTSTGSTIQYLDDGSSVPIKNQPDLASKIYHPLIEGGAMTLGGSAGTAIGGPLAGVAGAAAMYPPAKQFANAIDEYRGLQEDEPDTTSPLPQSGKDFETGLGIEAIGAGMKPIFGMVGNAIKSGIKKGISATLGPSEEAIAARLANPDLDNSLSYSQLAYKLPKTLDFLKQKITQAMENASSLLRNVPDPEQGAIPKSQINNMIGKLANDLQTSGVFVGPSRQAAGKQMSSLMSDISGIMKPQAPAVQILDATGKAIPFNPPDVPLPETTVKDILQAVRSNINWEDKGLSESNKVLTNFSGKLDSLLKANNPKYAEAMKPVSQMMDILDDTMHAFNLTKVTGEGIQPTDTTISKLQSVPTEKKSVSQSILNDLKRITGEDYLQQSKNYGYAREFQGGKTNGSRRVNLGLALGGPIGAAAGYLTGHPMIGAGVGEGIGAGVGALTDQYGGPMAASVVDRLVSERPYLQNIIRYAPNEVAKRAVIAALLNANESGPSQ